MDLHIEPVTSDNWKDLEALFAAKGCSMARGCWCMAYRESGAQAVTEGKTPTEARKAKLRALAREAKPAPGLLAYRVEGRKEGAGARTPVGWVTLGPREHFARLAKSPVMKPVDAAPVWSVVCFVVPPAFRHQGVAHALLQGAVAFAKQRGATLLEAYPVDKDPPGADDWLWHGAASMYGKAGFVEVARRKPTRPVVRLQLTR